MIIHEISPTITDPVIPDSGRVVLLEELTGASCPNCPKGSKVVDQILDKYGDKVAVVAVHGEFLAEPTSKSKYDFRNPKAKDLENWLKPWIGKPAATCNRIDQNSVDEKYAIFNTGLWQSNVQEELQKDHHLNLLMKVKYSDATRLLELDITAIPLVNISGDFNISVYLTESGIVDAQKNGSVIEQNFEFKHILRDMITKHDGDFFGSNLLANSTNKKYYSYTLPKTEDGLWNTDNMEVVVSIHGSSANNRTVLRAAHKHIK